MKPLLHQAFGSASTTQVTPTLKGQVAQGQYTPGCTGGRQDTGRQGSVSELGELHIHELPAVQTSRVPTPSPTSTGRLGLRPSHNQGNHCPSHPPTGVQLVINVKSFLISCLILTMTFLHHQVSSLVATKQPQGKCLWERTLSSH